jgi:exopolysaccharide biosynthesis polyprenyl glycosylphosphotransferase
MALPFYRRGNWAVIAIYGVISFFINSFYGGYRVGYYLRGNLIFSGIVSITVVNALTYVQVLAIARVLPNWSNLRPILWLTGIDIALIWIWATAATKLYLKYNPPRHLLLVYGGDNMAESLFTKILQRGDKYVIEEAINIDRGISEVLKKVDAYQSVLICDVKSAHRGKLLKYCYARDIRVYMTPKISDIIIRAATEINLFDSPLLLSRNEGLDLEQRAIKRVMDIVLSLIGLVVASPLMLIVAAAVKIEDRGPIIYSQTRLTQGGHEFKLRKFRSMIPEAEKITGAKLASQHDSRITRVGRVIRAARLDELPQLWNILKGDMSFVGPRPERPEIAEMYCKMMVEFSFRLKVKAGLTGYAQVLGKYNTTPYDKLKLDLMYIAGYSPLLDVKLILQTIKTLFMRESTEGVEENSRDVVLPEQKTHGGDSTGDSTA